MEQLSIALFLAALNKTLVDYIAEPVRQKFPQGDFWWLQYVALVMGLFIGWLGNVNLFALYIPDPVVGRILTAILIGGGSSLIHDVFSGPDDDAAVELY